MESLDKYRSVIDIIDKEMIRLFEQRMNIAHKIGEYKIEHGLEITNVEREEEVINKGINYLSDNSYVDEVASFLKSVMSISVDHQLKLIEE